MPFGIGIWEMLILLLVLLLVFGPKRLPEMGRQLGKGLREFKDTITGDHDDRASVVVVPEGDDGVSVAALAVPATDDRAEPTAARPVVVITDEPTARLR
jgi:sec-independent protein translocase protein TatA